MIDRHAALQAQAEGTWKDASASQDDAAIAAAVAAADAAAASAGVPAAPPAAPGVPETYNTYKAAPAPVAAPVQNFSGSQERAFGAAGGSYGRAALGAGRKPASNEKSEAIRKALCNSLRPKA